MIKNTFIAIGSLSILIIGSGITFAADALSPYQYQAAPQAASPAFVLPASPPVAKRFFPYVRGDLGMNNYSSSGGVSGSSASLEWKNFGYIFGVGAGAAFDEHLRADITAEYRTVEKGTLNCTGCGNALLTHSVTTMGGFLNGYYDFENFSGFTPYVGAGVGYFSHKVEKASFSVANTTLADGDSSSFGWNLQLGTSYDVSANATVDLNYRFASLGDIEYTTHTGTTQKSTIKYKDLYSHDFRVGLRYYFD